jgi:hypothetical protein
MLPTQHPRQGRYVALPTQHPRQGRYVAIRKPVILGLAAIFALLVARSVPPDFSQIGTRDSSITAVSNHDQRPHFDLNGLQWSAPVSAFFPLPPTAISSPLATASVSWSTIQSNGFHYNRPPPAS